jgi:hypothetical protein
MYASCCVCVKLRIRWFWDGENSGPKSHAKRLTYLHAEKLFVNLKRLLIMDFGTLLHKHSTWQNCTYNSDGTSEIILQFHFLLSNKYIKVRLINEFIYLFTGSQNSSVSLVTSYGIDGLGFECWQRLKFQTGSWAHPASCTMDTGAQTFPRKLSGRDLRLTNHLI